MDFINTLHVPIRNIQQVTLPIYNLTCGGGGSLILERVLARMPGVVAVYVNSATEMTYIRYDADQCTGDYLTFVIAQTGFGPRGISKSHARL